MLVRATFLGPHTELSLRAGDQALTAWHSDGPVPPCGPVQVSVRRPGWLLPDGAVAPLG
jgi:hypothetical protein